MLSYKINFKEKITNQVYKIIFLIAVFLFLPTNSFSQETLEAKNSDTQKTSKFWNGHAEGGSTLVKGNTNQESVYGKINVTYKKEDISNLLKTRLENTKADKARIKERYDINNNFRYNFTKKNFTLLELEYIDDRYGGYDYRISESIGYGRNFIDEKTLDFSGQISAGSRQIKFTNSGKEESWLIRVGGDLNWKIKEDVEFKQHLDVSFDKETEIIRSDTSIKVKMKSLSESVYFTASYFLEKKSSTASSQIKNTDSTMMLMFGYDF